MSQVTHGCRFLIYHVFPECVLLRQRYTSEICNSLSFFDIVLIAAKASIFQGQIDRGDINGGLGRYGLRGGPSQNINSLDQ